LASQAEREFETLYELVMPALARAAIGDFDAEIEVDRENPMRVNEVLMGVSVLLEVIRDLKRELAEAEAKLAKKSGVTVVPLLDEVLKAPAEKTPAD
jgi:hypothetical protein